MYHFLKNNVIHMYVNDYTRPTATVYMLTNKKKCDVSEMYTQYYYNN